MIGLIKLNLPNGEPFYFNPNFITGFGPNNPYVAQTLGFDPEKTAGKGSFMYCGGVWLQVLESPNQIVNSITRLRQKAEDNALQLRKKAEREDWEDWEEDEEE